MASNWLTHFVIGWSKYRFDRWGCLSHNGLWAYMTDGNVCCFSDSPLAQPQCLPLVQVDCEKSVVMATLLFCFKKCIWKCRLQNNGHFVRASLIPATKGASHRSAHWLLIMLHIIVCYRFLEFCWQAEQLGQSTIVLTPMVSTGNTTVIPWAGYTSGSFISMD